MDNYSTLIAARAFLRRGIALDYTEHEAGRGPLDDNARLMRVYGYMARLDEQIAQFEIHAFRDWQAAQCDEPNA